MSGPQIGGIMPKSNISNYSGVFVPGADYKKFDFVFHTGDGLFYYARKDAADGRFTYLTGDNRFTIDDVEGPNVNGLPSYYIYDYKPELNTLGTYVQEGQQVYLGGSSENSNGYYNVLSVERDYSDIPTSESFDKIATALNASNIAPSWYASTWFFRPELGEEYYIKGNYWWLSQNTNWAYNVYLGWVYISPVINQSEAIWFFLTLDENKDRGNGIWLYTNSSILGNDSPDSNSFLYLRDELGLNSAGPDGRIHWMKDPDEVYDSIFYNYGNQQWYGFNRGAPISQLSRSYTPPSEISLTPAELNEDNQIHRIQIQGQDQATKINNFESRYDNNVYLSGVILDPAYSNDVWSTNLFFFDSDYGASVSFEGNNFKQEFGNGYYVLQPKNINSLSFEADLTFKNRTNREAKAIIHFVENHLGQMEKDSTSTNLAYAQGVSGFRWDGNATFHPYDSNEMQSKTFYCSEFNHSLNFENSNDITLKLRNLNTSILRKSEELYVKSADDYSDTDFYFKNDVVFASGNHAYYYFHSGDSYSAGVSNIPPVSDELNWTRESGYYKDLNTNYWTRDFFWKPSIGLSVDQKPRMKEVAMGTSYTQIYRDGINESLLNLDLQFNNRDDDEAYAILHFLEQHLAYLPFRFTPPAPYDSQRNFVCQQWSHKYNYKNNHSISAKFEEFPINIGPEEMESAQSPPELSDGELVFSSPLVLAVKGGEGVVTTDQVAKKRMFLKNIGDKPIQLNGATLNPQLPNTFSILGQGAGNVPAVQPNLLSSDDYIVTLPNDASLQFPEFDLRNKTVKFSKSYENGLENGHTFHTMQSTNPPVAELVNGVRNVFFQNNLGQIKSGMNEAKTSKFYDSEHFVITTFLQQNTTSTLDGGEEAYIDIKFNGISEQDKNLLAGEITEDSHSLFGQEPQLNWTNSNHLAQGDLIVSNNERYYNCDIEIASSTPFSPQTGLLKIFISSPS